MEERIERNNDWDENNETKGCLHIIRIETNMLLNKGQGVHYYSLF